jgi:hypothetical protein
VTQRGVATSPWAWDHRQPLGCQWAILVTASRSALSSMVLASRWAEGPGAASQRLGNIRSLSR